MTRRISWLFLVVAVTLLQPVAVQAHFLWLVQAANAQGKQLHVYFGELAEADDPVLLERVEHVSVKQVSEKGQLHDLKLTKGADSRLANLGKHSNGSMFVLSHDLGVISRGGDTFLLRYYAKTGPALGDEAWRMIDCGKQLALTIVGAKPGTTEPNKDQKPIATADNYPVIPEMVTSFGAAIAGDALYVYGGHTGRAHAYSNETQANTLRRLNLKNPKTWESLGDGPGLQGLAMVAHGGKLYRLGGFTAKNKEGEDQDLWSQAGVSCFDPASKQWSEMSPLPEPRSSFDAAVLNDSIYVVGGWKMAGKADSVWHKTAYALDLSSDAPQWKALPEPPFQRRALCLASYDGKIYAIGGMQEKGGPTTRVGVFDPARNEWSNGPSLQGEAMDGFGSSSFAAGGRLYATTYSGKLQRLSADGASWEIVAELARARFFHRMLRLSNTKLISVGGASMTEGKFEEVDVIDLSLLDSRTDATTGADL